MKIWDREPFGAVMKDGIFRYALWRSEPTFEAEGAVLFIGMNPSTADARWNDATIRRELGFVRSWGFRYLLKANLGAFIATHPSSLDRAKDPVGPENDVWLRRLADQADLIVCAWGIPAKPLAHRPEAVLSLLRGKDLFCLGLTKYGHPRHPLYVRRGNGPQRFDPEGKS